MILLGAGKCSQCFQAACFQLAPRDEGIGIDFQLCQGSAAGMGSENFSEEFDFLENRAVAEIFRVDVINKNGEIFRKNQSQHVDVACVLAGTLVKADKAMAFAAKEIDGIHHFDVAVVDDSFEQTGMIP